MERLVYLKIQGNKERFYVYDDDSDIETSISISNDRLGYMLCRILDLDYTSVFNNNQKYVYKFDSLGVMYKSYDPQIYNDLICISEVNKLYPPESLSKMVYDYSNNDPSVSDIIDRLRSYVNFHAEKQLQYDCGFFDFLFLNGFFGSELIFDYLDEIDGNYEYFLSCSDDPAIYNDLDAHYAHYSAQLPINRFDSEKVYDITVHNRIALVALITIRELSYRNKIVKKCRNCGRYFVAENRIDTVYCDNPSPDEPALNCKEYVSRRLSYKRQRDDELASLFHNISAAKCMRVKRNPGNQTFKDQYDSFRRDCAEWKKELAAEPQKRDQYRAWLLEKRLE